MLDHWHAVFAIADGKNISERMNIIDSWISKQTEAPLKVLADLPWPAVRFPLSV